VTEISALRDPFRVVPTTRNESLPASTVDKIRRSVPPNTARAYHDDWRRFAGWCKTELREALPASAQTLAAYVDHLADAGRAPSTIDRAIASVLSAHEAAGVPKPNTKLARSVLKTTRRDRATEGVRVAKARAVTIDVLRAMVDALAAGPVGIRDRALLVVGFALGARRSELAGLDIADLEFTEAGLAVVIRTSKTDQESEGRDVAIPYGSHPETCPVRTTQAWLAVLAESGRTTGPLFVRIDRHGVIGRAVRARDAGERLSGQAVAIVVRRAALAAGMDPTAAWSGHSLRRGFATATYEAGADPLRIARHGGWKDGSKTLLGYVEEVNRWKDNPLVGVGL